MYIFKIKHFLCVLSTASVLFCASGCARIADSDTVPGILPIETLEERTTLETSSAVNGEESFSEISTSVSSQSILNRENLIYMNDHYGVNILYGSDVIWSYGSYSAGITDESLIAERLSLLDECLSEYPLELFEDLSSIGPITINLMDDLGGADGYTDAGDSYSIQIALSCSNSATYFKRAFHHELFHFMEYYMMYSASDYSGSLYNELAEGTDLYTDVSLYGTDGYEGTIYDSDADIYHQYFTSVYGKTNAIEDRAEIFSYYMCNTMKESMKVNDSPISMKMKVIASAIRSACPSLAEYPVGTLPWEENITY